MIKQKRVRSWIKKDFEEALKLAMRTGNFKEFKTEDEALDYAKNYKKGTPLEKFKPGK